MEKAQEIMRRSHDRKVYKLCGEVPIPHSTNNSQEQDTSKGIASSTKTDKERLKDFISNKIEHKDFCCQKRGLSCSRGTY